MIDDKARELPDNEIARRRDEIVRRMANTPPQPKTKKKGGRAKKRGRPAKTKKTEKLD